MCWCTPSIRTPHCGKIGCRPDMIAAGDWAPPIIDREGDRIVALQAKTKLTEGESIELTMLLQRRWAKP